jgi:uncharacterized protein YjbJ (UPF0337 family)
MGHDGRRAAALPAEESKLMNSDQLEGQWKQIKGKVKEKWGKLTDSDLDVIAGKRDQFLGKLQERYGFTKEQAERDLSDWERSQGHSKVA